MAGEDLLFQRFGREFPRGHILFREGEVGREMFVIQAGKVSITKKVRDVEKTLVTLGAGEFFGEMAILNAKPRSAGAVVAEDAKLLVIDPKTFEAMVRGNVEIAVRLIKKLSDRLQEADDQIENLMLRDPNSRVVHYIMRQAEQRGRASSQGVVLALNLKEVSGKVGIKQEQGDDAVGKILKAKIVIMDPAGVIIPDIAKLKQYLEFLEMKEKFGEE